MTPHVTSTRPPAVAGAFYPDDPGILRDAVRRFIDDADVVAEAETWPKAIIGPHAGYAYSGPIAGSAYKPLRPAHGTIRRVVVMGPAHRVAFTGLATVSVDAFDTPIGRVPVDRDAIDAILGLPDVITFDAAHEPEHGLEVHLPFLIETLGEVAIVPLLFGDASCESAARVFNTLWNGRDTLIVVSSDLSHYHDYDTATRLDRATADAIVENQPQRIGPHEACGHTAIAGLLAAAEGHQPQARCVDLRNSGDTAGPPDRVVGYGAFLFH